MRLPKRDEYCEHGVDVNDEPCFQCIRKLEDERDADREANFQRELGIALGLEEKDNEN